MQTVSPEAGHAAAPVFIQAHRARVVSGNFGSPAGTDARTAEPAKKENLEKLDCTAPKLHDE
jgi:hypothetical protein